MNIKNVLSKLDLKDKKADIYLACLESRGLTAYAIAKKMELKRPTVYDILNSLMKEGLVYVSFKKGSKCYYPAEPEVLLKKLRKREEELNEIMPFLNSLYNKPNSKKPIIKYFEGVDGIKEMYGDSLASLKKGEEMLVYCGQDVLRYLPKYVDQYVNQRVKKGIGVRGIYKKTKELSGYMEKNKEQLREVKIVKAELFPLNNEINIYNNKLAIASYNKEFFGILIESEEIYRSQRAIFELAWMGADKI
jgi:sugar-specific transcriptional regulator TrmB